MRLNLHILPLLPCCPKALTLRCWGGVKPVLPVPMATVCLEPALKDVKESRSGDLSLIPTNGHGHGHEWPTATRFVQCQSALPFWDTAISKFDHENPWSRLCVRSKVKVMFDLQNSKVKVMVKVQHIGHIWGLEFNQYVCFLFLGNRTTFGWDIRNSIFDLENSWSRSDLMVTFEALSTIDTCAFHFVAIAPFLAEI